jgi:hypothetical protein
LTYGGVELGEWPALTAYLARMQERPAIRDAITLERELLKTSPPRKLARAMTERSASHEPIQPLQMVGLANGEVDIEAGVGATVGPGVVSPLALDGSRLAPRSRT